MFKVIAVVVTHNRLTLLQEAVAALKAQTFAPYKIVVVNNSSTDGTTEWLDAQTEIIVKHQANTGASGGFCTGITLAKNYDPDWLWLMDDDSICRSDTLQILIDKCKMINEPVGFIGSKSVWTDGSPHLMNLPNIKPSFNNRIPFNKYDDKNLLLIETSSFVSLLVNARAIEEVGLPYHDFFIWSDDQEFTRRVTKAGYMGLYASESVVLHKTAVNYFPDFYRDNAVNLWKYGYGFRNEFFLVKRNKGFLYFLFWLPAKVGYTSLQVLRIRNDNRLKFIRLLFNSAWRSIFYNPKIQKA